MSVFHQNILAGASGAGGAASDPVFPEEVFSCDIYAGNGSARSITNGIDLSGEGGLVWIKRYDGSQDNVLQDTESGVSNMLRSHDDGKHSSGSGRITAFNSDGFTLGTDSDVNANNQDYVAWTFRKAPGFFDIQTWTGNGSNRTISHTLGSTPGFIIVKRTSATEDWTCYHRGIGATKYLQLNGDGNAQTLSQAWNDTEPTSTVFSIGTHDRVNTTGQTYIAYIFAHNEQTFGEDQDKAVVHCGSYTGTNNKNGNKITTGFEPQFILFKKHTGAGSHDWCILDIARGMQEEFASKLFPNNTNGQVVVNDAGIRLLNDGFDHRNTTGEYNKSHEYTYMAIGRPTKEPSAASEVFDAVARTGNGDNSSTTFTDVTCDIGPVDLAFAAQRTDDSPNIFVINKIGHEELESSSTAAEQMYISNDKNPFEVPGNKGIQVRGDDASTNRGGGSYTYIFHFFKRFRKFFDVVLYDGTGSSGLNVTHGLGVKPDLLICKQRNAASSWGVYANVASMGATKYMLLNDAQARADDAGYWNDTEPTASQFTLGGDDDVNRSGGKYVALLFANLPGICKIGSYTGTGNDITIDCGFTAGARFVMIKKVTSGDGWYIMDTERGIVSGNDPWIRYNQDNAEITNTDVIDPTNSGFIVASTGGSRVNDSDGSTYLFFAIA